MSLILFPIVVIENMTKTILGTLGTHWEIKRTPWEPFNAFLNYFWILQIQKYKQGILIVQTLHISILIMIWCLPCC
jgi:hypothetical protein